MNIKDIFNLAVKKGIESDPRGYERVNKLLEYEKSKYQKLGKEEQEEFDTERLSNPYSDTRILNLGGNGKIKKILAGIDISVSEILMADWLSKKGEKIDLIISHHPLGKALASLDETLKLQADVLADQGVPINIAESLLETEIDELGRKLSPGNHYRVVDAAKILDMPLICTHTVCDNLVYSYLAREIGKKKPERVEDLIRLIKAIAEYRQAIEYGMGPKIFTGSPSRRCGKIALTEITGGTSGSKHIYERLAHAGVGTIVGMHMDEEHKEEAAKHHINVVVAGHMSSDSLGMNLFLDELEIKGIKVIACSGLIRIKRK